MPPKSKKQGVNQHDKRHDNGLIQPGKRVTRSASNGNLNGHVNGKPSATTTTTTAATITTLPSTSSPGAAAVHAQDKDSQEEIHDDTNGTSAGTQFAMAGKKSVENLRLERRASGAVETPGSETQTHERAQDADTSGIKQDAFANGLFTDRASTVIGPSTLRDVIAILLLLLQLPSKALVFIQICFVSLTLGSSAAAGWSLPSLASSPDWLQGHGGNPSILTTVTADIVFLIVWFLLPIGKDLILDLAQVYIATSLGGGVAGGGAVGGGTPGVICMCILGFSHLLRHKSSRHYTANIVLALMSKSDLAIFKDAPPLPAFVGSAYAVHSRPRILLEIHIITQGIVRIIRRAIYRRLEPRSKSGKRNDNTESIAMSRATSILFPSDTTVEGARSGSTDGRPPGLPPAVRDGKEKTVSSGKRRRKQATFVRSQQPFWAAIANTKVTVSKEIEHSQASRDAFEADASNAKQHASKGMGDRVWISQIEDTEIAYSVSFAEEPEWDENLLAPIRVRVNNAPWKSSLCVPVNTEGDGAASRHLFRGKITGLTAATSLIVEFVRESDDVVLYSASLVTRPIANSDQGITIPTQPQEALSPSSPTTTLRNAIAAAEVKVNEVKERMKKSRRAHRSTTSSLQTTNDNLESRMNSFGGNDDKQKQRQIQYTSSIRLAEEEIANITAKIEELGEIPEEMRQSTARSEELWKGESSLISAIREDLDNCRAEADRQVATAQAANKVTRQKRERLQARLTRLMQQRDTLISANDQARRDILKRNQDHAAILAQRTTSENIMQNNIAHIEHDVTDHLARVTALEQNNFLFWDSLQQQQTYAGIPPSYTQQFHERNGSLPHSPDNGYQSLVTGGGINRGAPPGLGPNSINYRTGTPPIISNARRSSVIRHIPTKAPRARSSSMLSEISGFTEDDGDEENNENGATPAEESSSSSMLSKLSVQSPPFAPSNGLGAAGLPSSSSYFHAAAAAGPVHGVINDRRSEGSGSGSGSGSGTGSGNLTRRGSEQLDLTTTLPMKSPQAATRQSPIGSELLRRGGSPRNWGR